MPTDCGRGLAGPPPFACETANDAWDGLVHAFLTHGAHLSPCLERLLAAAPEEPLPHAANGLLLMLLARRELVPASRASHRAAVRGLADTGGTARDRLYVAALGAWLDGRPSLAVEGIDAILAACPGDAFAVKLAHAIRFVLGDTAGMRLSVERVLPAFAEAHPAAGYVRGCHAFALEETGDYRAAEGAGRAGLELAPDDAWGFHAVAHVFEMTSRVEDGRRWLEARRSCVSKCNNFRYHVWWHQALFELDLGNIERVLELYDREIRAERSDDYRDIANAASLLARLAIEGIDVGDRWNELAELSEARLDDGCLAFADAHYALALANGGRRAACRVLVERLARDGENAAASDYALTAGEVGAPAARGIEAFALGRYDSAFRALLAAREHMQSIGGSHAQRDVFERLTIEAALRAGRASAARRLIGERTRARGTEDRFGHERLARLDLRPQSAFDPEPRLSLVG
jgi:tetratricopeptide (TPR) repeat protein